MLLVLSRLFFLSTLGLICLIKIVKTDKRKIMEAIFVFLFVICIALFFKVMSWRDEKQQQHYH